MKLDLNNILHLIDKKPPAYAFSVYIIIKHYYDAGEPVPSVRELSKMITSYNLRTLYRGVKWLCDNGFLSRTENGSKFAKKGKPSVKVLEKFCLNSDDHNYCGIYKITNKANNKFYIGQSKGVKYRCAEHFSLLRTNRHTNWRLQYDFNKFGEHSFTWEILRKVEETELLKEEAREIHKALIDGDIQIYNLEIPNLITLQEDK